MISSRPEVEALARASTAAAVQADSAADLPPDAAPEPGADGARVRAPGQQFLSFGVGDETYATAIDAIREILQVPALTQVPLVPAFVRGVINLRGSVVPVIDLSTRFALGDTRVARRTCIVVVEVAAGDGAEESRSETADQGSQVLGLMVDAVHEVIEIAPAAIEPTPVLGTRIESEFIRGMARVDGKLVVVLNLNRVLAQQELASLVAHHEAF
jgi:purine-binding chemotaxis protein CheW